MSASAYRGGSDYAATDYLRFSVVIPTHQRRDIVRPTVDALDHWSSRA